MCMVEVGRIDHSSRDYKPRPKGEVEEIDSNVDALSMMDASMRKSNVPSGVKSLPLTNATKD